MSFDLAVWHSSRQWTDEEAQARYLALCESEGIESLIEPHQDVARFIAELTARYPQIDDLPDELIDDGVWTCAFDVSPGHCIMPIAWSRAEEVVSYVMELALKCGLVCYDPQASKVHLPPALQGGT